MRFMTWLAIMVGRISWLPKLLPYIVGVDMWIQRVTKERIALLDIAGLPNVTLLVPGRKSGQLRSTRLLCAPVSQGWLIAGSYFGAHQTPSWVFNLRAVDTAQVAIKGRVNDVAVVEPTGADLDDCWDALDAVWPNFPRYRARAGRDVPVFRLETIRR